MSHTDSSGSWELPEDLRMLRDTIRRFMKEEVKPVEDTLPHDAYTPEPEALKALQKKARDIGLWCLETPAEHGGAGLSLLGQCVAAEETAKCRMGAYIAGCGAFGFDQPNVIWKGSEHQQRFARDDVEAYRWFVLAAAAWHPKAAGNRYLVARRLTPAQRAEGDRLAREWS